MPRDLCIVPNKPRLCKPRDRTCRDVPAMAVLLFWGWRAKRMQSLLIVTELYDFDVPTGCLRARCHDGCFLQVMAEPGQRVNCDLLLNLPCPFFLLSDRPAEAMGDMLMLSPRTLISVPPFSTAEVAAMLDSGQAELLLEQALQG